MSRKTLILLVACLAIVGAAILSQRRPEKGELSGPRPRPIPAIAKDTIVDLKVTLEGKTSHLKKDGTWKLLEPIAAAADEQAAKTAAEKLEQLEFGSLVTDQPARHADLELAEDRAVKVVGSDKDGKVLVELLVGKAAGSQTMVRQPGKNDVWQVQGAIKYLFAKDAKAWREKTIAAIKREDITEISLSGPDGKVTLVEEKVEGKPSTWRATSTTVPLALVDAEVMQGIVSGLTSLRASDFADGVSLADAGLEPPSAKQVSVKLKDGKTITITLGKAKGDDYYVRSNLAPEVFLVRKFGIERLLSKPIDLREKTIADIKVDDVAKLDVTGTDGVGFTLERSGETFKMTRPKGESDPVKTKAVASSFASFKAWAFADTKDPKVTGLGKPSMTATVRTKKGDGLTLTVGGLKDSTDYYVQVKGRPEILLVRKFLIDRLRKKPDDLKGGAAASPRAL